MPGFKQKYTPGNVITAIRELDNIATPRLIADKIGCHKLTVENLLKHMLATDQVKRVNVGTENKKVWIYSRCE